MDSAASLEYQRYTADLNQRNQQMINAILARVPGAKAKDEGWAWRIIFTGRGSVLMRRDAQWVSISSAQGTEFLDGVQLPAPGEALVEKIVALLDALPPAPTPAPQQTPPTPLTAPAPPPTLVPLLPDLPDPPAPEPVPSAPEHIEATPPTEVFSVHDADEPAPAAPRQTGPRRRPTTGAIRRAEVKRLQADAKIFEHYRF